MSSPRTQPNLVTSTRTVNGFLASSKLWAFGIHGSLSGLSVHIYLVGRYTYVTAKVFWVISAAKDRIGSPAQLPTRIIPRRK